MGKYLILILLVFSGLDAISQDSVITPQVDTQPPKRVVRRTPPRPRVDTLVKDSLTTVDSLAVSKIDRITGIGNMPAPKKGLALSNHPYFRFTDPVRLSSTKKEWTGKETLFYSMIALLLFFALIRNGFHRYVEDLLKSYFRTTMKQRQLKEQLIQSPLPSLLLNVFFVLSIGMFIALALQHFQLGTDIPFWNLYLYCIIGLVCVYAVKYLTLKLLGWVFQVSEATEGYIFIVFTTNKVLGMFLIPFLVVLAFSYGVVNQTALTLSIVVVAGILVYRFFLSYVSLKDKVRVGFVHFLIYLLAFEIAPLLLINKLLFRLLGETS
jgi:hypothetical protein